MHDLYAAESFHRGAVWIGAVRVTGLQTGLEEFLDKRVRGGVETYVERAILAMELIVEDFVMFGALEVGQHVLVAPARIAQGRPGVEVLRMAAVVSHGIYR
ncbi:hypothetical protein D3C80_1224870 [compost metagenome]